MNLDIIVRTKNQIWTTRAIALELYGSDTPANMKKTERWLGEQGLNFPLLNEITLLDEHLRAAKVKVTKHIINTARRKRHSVLFVAMHTLASGTRVLFANDGRKGRRWIFLTATNLTHQTLEPALKRLALGENKNTIIVPSGALVAVCRALCREWRGHDINLGNTHKLRLALEVYSHGQGDIYANVDETLRQKLSTEITHLDRLEAEAIYIMREVIAEADNPVMLYSVGKDSQVILHLARKAFYPSPPPFPLLHIDTRWKFQAMYDFRDYMAHDSGMDLLVHTNPEGIEKNINPFDHGSAIHTEFMKTMALKQALEHYNFDMAFGGARRDEEASRAKERICSFRTAAHRWDPKNQRPELWRQYNLRKHTGESIRVFPISNWTELDIWQYIYREEIPIVPLYFAAERPVIERNGMLIMVDDDRLELQKNETIHIKKVRFRSLGCYPLAGAMVSDADDLALILIELASAKTSERLGRAIDTDSSASMEKKKHEGYF
jgi:sulfate adenylyltransferase subunit 2